MTSVADILVGITAALLVVRHISQLWIDICRRHRSKRAVQKTWAKGGYIVVMYTIVFVGCTVSFLRGHYEPSARFVFGVSLVWAGALLGIASIVQLGQSYSFDLSMCDDFRLATRGVYGISRHPMRAGLAIECLGLIMASGAFVLVLPWLALVIVQVVRTRAEESMLSEHLGHAYEVYCKNVPQWNLLAGILKSSVRRPAAGGRR